MQLVSRRSARYGRTRPIARAPHVAHRRSKWSPRVIRRGRANFFSPQRAQHVRTRTLPGFRDVVGGVAMVLGIVSWAVALALLAA